MAVKMMNKAIRASIGCHILLLLLVGEVQAENFDVKNYGAKGDGKTDDSKALTGAWTAACGATTASTMVIGKGTYLAGPVEFKGPCKAQVTVQVQGTVQAPSDISLFKESNWIVFSYTENLHVLGGGIFDGQGSVAWSKNDCAKTGECNSLPANIRFNSLTNAIIQDITSKDSKLFHMNILGCKNITLQNININAPGTSLNTDGIHIGRSNGVNITGATIKTGDDCVSLGDGCQQVNVEGVTCGPGHGISVGSLGKYKNESPVIGVTVKNCSLSNTMNGIRIKTWPASPAGVASNIQFMDITMTDVGTPILIDQEYCPSNQCEAKVPSRVKLSNITFKNIHGTSTTEVAMKLVCSKGVPCEKVDIGDINLTYKTGKATSVCANVKPQVTGTMAPAACANTTA